jgi:hypothetical protein
MEKTNKLQQLITDESKLFSKYLNGDSQFTGVKIFKLAVYYYIIIYKL